MTTFPEAITEAQFGAVRRDDDALRPGVDAVLARHGVRGVAPARFASGSLPVYAVGERVLKLFPPCFAGEQEIERGVLEAVAGRLPVPTPEVHASGELDGWRYVLMTHLRGEPLVAAWPGLSRPERVALGSQLGEAMAALHALAPGAPTAPRPDWARFLETQRAGCADRHRARGLEARWAEQIPSFLDAVAPTLEGASMGLLHTEIMREHLLIERSERGPRLSGLFDFEPAMIGACEYDLASVGVFVSGGDAPFLGALLRAYGVPASAIDHALRRRCLAYALLHRYGSLHGYLARVPPSSGARTLDDLAAEWWATDAA